MGYLSILLQHLWKIPCAAPVRRIYSLYISVEMKVRLQIVWNLCPNKRYIFNYSLLHLLVSYIALNGKEDICSLLEPQQ